MNHYPVNATVRITVTFKTLAGALHDPTTAVIDLASPRGVLSQVTMVRQSLGTYTHDLVLSVAGRWAYRGRGTTATSFEAFVDGEIYADHTDATDV